MYFNTNNLVSKTVYIDIRISLLAFSEPIRLINNLKHT